jgi:ribosome-binding protein aMBF1 (putative translation factor)
MSKFLLTGVLFLVLASFLRYSPTVSTSAPKPKGQQKETIIFPISEQIKLARLEKHLSSKDLANKVGLSKLNLERIEKGTVTPTREVLFKIEQALNTQFTLDGY